MCRRRIVWLECCAMKKFEPYMEINPVSAAGVGLLPSFQLDSFIRDEIKSRRTDFINYLSPTRKLAGISGGLEYEFLIRLW